MKAGSQRTHLRLVHSNTASELGASHCLHDQSENVIQRLFLPFSGETLWLRLLPCECGGMKLFYVKIVRPDQIEEHKPYFFVSHESAEEIVYSKHVNYGKLHRFFRVNPARLVANRIFRLQKLLLRRDEGLYQSTEIKRFFDKNFGLDPTAVTKNTKSDA